MLEQKSLTIRELSIKLDISSVAVGSHHLKGKKGLIGLGFIRVSKGELGVKGAEIFELTEKGRKFLNLPQFGLLSGYAGRRKVDILKVLVNGSLNTIDIGQKLCLNSGTILQHLMGKPFSSKWRSGLIELGFVERFGRGVRSNPYVYNLTDKGRHVLNELETFFSELLS